MTLVWDDLVLQLELQVAFYLWGKEEKKKE